MDEPSSPVSLNVPSPPNVPTSSIPNTAGASTPRLPAAPATSRKDETAEEEYQDALATLMWRKDLTVRPMYDHISAIIRHVYKNRGKEDLWNNKLDLLSRLVKRSNVPPIAVHHIKPGYVPPTELPTFLSMRDFFATLIEEPEHKKVDHNGPLPQGVGYVPPEHPVEYFPPPAKNDTEEGGEEGEEGETKKEYKPIDMYEWLFYAQEAGLGLTQTETFLVMSNILRFQKANYSELQNMRFWGRIAAAKGFYYVLEVEFKEMSEKWFEQPAVLETHPELANHKVTVYNPFGTYGFREDYEDTFFTLNLPKFPIPPPPETDPDQHFKEIMVEECGTGANMYCYYVCTDLLVGEWYRLPDVTPEQIRKARFIRRGLTGNLEAKVVACPTFPGVEKNYLRAQMARITHGTALAPLGQFVSPEDEEDAGEEGQAPKFKLVDNPEFEHPNQRQLLSKDLSGYTHLLPYLLRQGRTTWYDRSPGGQKLGDEDEEEEEEEPPEEPPEEGEEGAEGGEEVMKKKKLKAKPETGPSVFNPITEDQEVAKDVPAWIVKSSQTCLPQNGVVRICSTLWPGAMCLVQRDKSENFYIGDGVTKGIEFTPFLPPAPAPIFNQNSKMLKHAADPAPQVEEEQRVKKEAAEKARLEAEENAKLDAEAAAEEAEDQEEGEETEEDEDQ